MQGITRMNSRQSAWNRSENILILVDDFATAAILGDPHKKREAEKIEFETWPAPSWFNKMGRSSLKSEVSAPGIRELEWIAEAEDATCLEDLMTSTSISGLVS